MNEDKSTIFLACDVILNILLKGDEIQQQLNVVDFVPLVRALPKWAGNTCDISVIMMAASICALVFELTSEDTLLKHCGVSLSTINDLSILIARSLTAFHPGINDGSASKMDLYQIVASGYTSWSDRFPSVKRRVECCSQS